MFVEVTVGVGVGVAPEVILQSNVAEKSKVLHGSVLDGVGVGQTELNHVSSKSGHFEYVFVGPNKTAVPPLVLERTHLAFVLSK